MGSEHRKESIKFSAVQGLFWLAIAVGGFMNVCMQEHGFSASEVGLVNALASAVGIVATPICGMLCDKIRSIKKVTIALYIIGAAMYIAVPISTELKLAGIPLVMIWIPFMSFFRTPFFTLTDNWLVQNSNRKGLNFGAIRSFGSMLYSVGGIGISFIIPYIGVSPVFLISSLMFIPVIGISLTIEDSYTEHGAKQSLKELQMSRLFKNYFYIIFLVFTFLLNILTTCDNNFLPYLLESVGESASDYGLVGGFRSLLEIPVLIGFKYVRKKIKPLGILAIVGLFYGVSSILLGGASKTLLHILLFSTLNGMACGVWIAFGSNHIYQMAPDGLKATAQTVFGATSSVAGILGNLVGGLLIDAVGANSVYVYLGIMMVATVGIYAVLHTFGERRQKAH